MRPRPAVLLTSSICLRSVFSRIRSFVFKPLRTLPSSVSRKSCVSNSYANCRVDINYSQSGTHPSHHHRHPRSFYSCTYELPILQTFCFDIHASNGGVYPPPQRSRSFVPYSLPAIAFVFNFLRTLLQLQKTQLVCFHAIPQSLHKSPACRGAPLAIPPAGSILWVAL